MVKTCYKIKIDFRDFQSCFCGANGILSCKTASLALQYFYYWKAREAVLHDSCGSMAMQKWLFCNINKLVLLCYSWRVLLVGCVICWL